MQRQRARTKGGDEINPEWVVDDQPQMVPSRQQLRDHQPSAYTTGYDPSGRTRVGVGTARGKIERLVRMNEGRHRSDGDHSTREAARDKKRLTESFCSALGVTPYQQSESISIMGQLNLDRFGQQKRIEKVALCVIRVVVDLDRERLFLNGQRPQDLGLSTLDKSDLPTKLGQNGTYCSLCTQHGLSEKDRFSITQLVKRELKEIRYFERAERPVR